MDKHLNQVRHATRRHFLKRCRVGLGSIALGALLAPRTQAEPEAGDRALLPRPPRFAARAKSVIYLHMSGSPPQQELFDWKPKLVEYNLKPCPDELLKDQRFAFIKGHPKLLGT